MKQELLVDGMTCQHCVNRVTKALEEINGVKNVKIDLDSKKVTIKVKDIIDEALLKQAVIVAGYKVIL